MQKHVIGMVLGLIWVVLFQVVFYSQTLYNSHHIEERRLSRIDILEFELVPTRGMGHSLLHGTWTWVKSGSKLLQRVPLAVGAAAVLAAAFLFGDALRRVLFRQAPSFGLEAAVFAYGFGMTTLSLLVQLLGLFGLLRRDVLGIAAVILPIAWFLVRSTLRPAPSAETSEGPREEPSPLILPIVTTLAVIPFVVLATLAASLPTPDYDAVAYHLLGPKEYWENGRITFLPHNVYTNFPFLTEMFHLLGMAIQNDWFLGGLTGQIVLSSFGPAAGAAVGLTARRFFGPSAGWLAAFCYLTTPWVYRLSSIPYVEGALLFFATMAIYSALRAGETRAWAMASGIFAGAAFGCKYTGVVMVGAPAAVFLVGSTGRRRLFARALAFCVGFTLVAGLWLVRNAVWTGNPVYPLLYNVFGGVDWSPELAEKFAKAHQSKDFRPQMLLPFVYDLVVRSDWQSGLLFCFAPFALSPPSFRRIAMAFWALLVYLFVAFWLFTHRLDRFFLPVEPFAAVLAGAGLAWTAHRAWRSVTAIVLIIATLYSLGFIASGLCGLNNYGADLAQQRELNIQWQFPALYVGNQAGEKSDRRVLYVGFAGVYGATTPTLYSTVFNENTLERLLKQPGRSDEMLPPQQAWAALQKENIGLVVVDWTWIARYRSEGNYGFTKFVDRDLFKRLTETGVLERVSSHLGNATYVTIEVYRVLDEEPRR